MTEKEIAAELLEKLQPEKFEDLAFVSATPYNKFTYTAENYGKQDKEKDGSYYTALRISYERTENGIPVIGNNANITVDCVSGKITQYSLTWTEEVDFADTEAKINPAEAVNAYFENGNTSLVYVMHTVYLYDEAAESDSAEKLPVKPVYSEIKTRNETRLVYNFSAPFYAISAVSGKALNYDGEEYVKAETESFDGFSDISGHWAEEKINLLSDIGVVLSADTFEPDAYITQKEFIAMLMACRNHYSEIYRLEDIDSQLESFVNDMKRSGYYIPEKDEDINPDSTLMRKDAAKFIMRALGYETVATIPGIFTTDFIDNAEIDPQYMGYAALAKGLGIINGSHGRFNGDQSITKAESVILVYNYLNAEK